MSECDVGTACRAFYNLYVCIYNIHKRDRKSALCFGHVREQIRHIDNMFASDDQS